MADLTPPFSIRLTKREDAALRALAAHDGLTRQDHIRRAIDFYLAAWINEQNKARDRATGQVVEALLPQPEQQRVPVPDHIASIVLGRPLKKRMRVVRR